MIESMRCELALQLGGTATLFIRNSACPELGFITESLRLNQFKFDESEIINCLTLSLRLFFLPQTTKNDIAADAFYLLL